MYEDRYEDTCGEEQEFTEDTLQEGLRELIMEGSDSYEICWENIRVSTFEEAGLMTWNKGLVLTLPDGSEFKLSSGSAQYTCRL